MRERLKAYNPLAYDVWSTRFQSFVFICKTESFLLFLLATLTATNKNTR
jgi:hypothetical protein